MNKWAHTVILPLFLGIFLLYFTEQLAFCQTTSTQSDKSGDDPNLITETTDKETPPNGGAIDHISINLSSSTSCATVQQLLAEIKSSLGENWSGQSSLIFNVRIELTQTQTYDAHLEIHDKNDTYTRQLTVNTCEMATKVMGLLIALTLDPTIELKPEAISILSHATQKNPSDQAETTTSAETTETAESKTKDTASKAETTKKDKKRESQDTPQKESKPKANTPPTNETQSPKMKSTLLNTKAGFLLDVGTLPTVSFGLSIKAEFGFKRLLFQLAANLLPTQSFKIENHPNGQLSLLGITLRMATGYTFTQKQFQFSPIAGVSLDYQKGQTTGIESEGDGSAFYASAHVGGQTNWQFSKYIGAFAFAGAAIPFNPPEFKVQSLGRVHKPAPVSFLANLGLFFKFF